MKFDPTKYHRHSIRLLEYDYSQPGAYFITLVTRGRECLFGDIKDSEMRLNETGWVVWDVWNSLPARYPHIKLGAAVVMPNHFHGIVIINNAPTGEAIPVRAIHESPLRGRTTERRRMTLPLVVGYFKMNSARRINEILDSSGIPVWQRNYYEHIIRDDEEHNRIHLYIESNIYNWVMDDENPVKKI
jgi:REP element-mobilizing transposase RayT